MSWRRDAYHKLLYVQRGRAELKLRNGQRAENCAGTAGAVWLVPAGVDHQIVDAVPSVILLLCVGSGWLQRIDGLAAVWEDLAARGKGGFVLGGPGAQEWERRWRRALLEQNGARVGADVLRDALALELLVALGREPERATEDSAEERVRRVTREVSETFLERWTIDSAAARAGLSRRHFTTWFRRINATTLVDFLNARRLDQAERLLASGRHTVTGAVFSSGFDDIAHFYRLFKRRHGYAPGAWLAGRIKE